MARIVIIGSGIAGLFAALRLADAGHNVTVITKQRPVDSSTNWAQGGIAAILDKTDGLGLQSHITDTLASGDGLCDEEVVRRVIEESGARIHDLLNIGVRFETNEDGEFHLAKEGGHSQRRILHAKDATGREIERALNDAASSHVHITLKPNTLAMDLIQREHQNPEKGIAGVWCLNQENNRVFTEPADVLMIATGGVGQLWSQTTNPPVATGDGLAMAYRAGAAVKDMAFIQFHPTALAVESDRPFLITEAMRGEGGVILDEEGLRNWRDAVRDAGEQGSKVAPGPFSFTLNHSPLGSMATRDIVARAIDQRLKETGDQHVYLITSHLDQDHLFEHFPNIQQRLNRHGLMLGRDPLPVSPAAHYIVGGLEVDEFGRPHSRETGTTMPSLYAIGEVACTGMHGANRLASNSLLEAVVYAARAANHIIESMPEGSDTKLPDWRADGLKDLTEHVSVSNDRESLCNTMSREVGIVRRFNRLHRASRRLQLLSQEVDFIWRRALPSRQIVELRNLVLVGQLVTEDAENRTENRGLHYNTDLIQHEEQ
ncbi:MAG TPA: FAD-dependent oxidoreductase [Candidatus Poseidoniaceae archaeon]|nr:FAD-dependent oxidoreductase [Candidatus Poseidoniaceae archaeon]